MTKAHPRRWQILFVILAAECMDLLDGTVVNVAGPTIHRDLGTSSTALQWIIGGYPLAIAVGLITGGRLGDLLGRKRMFLTGAAGFTAASVLCGFAPSTGVLIAARIAQGLFGALMLPQGLGVLRDIFPIAELPKAYAVFGPVMGSAALLGPIISGGLIDLDLFSSAWRSVFLINLPLGLAALVGAWRLVPRSRVARGGGLDLLGTTLVTVAAALIVYPLIQGRQLGWPAWTYASMAVGVGLLGIFGLHLRRRQRRGKEPLVTPAIFAYRGYSGGLLVLVLYFAGMVGASLAITLFLQLGQHFSAVHAGLTVIPFPLGVAITAPVSGGVLAKRFGRLVMQVGVALSATGYALVIPAIDGSHTTSWDLVVPLLLIGLGMGLLIAPLFNTIVGSVSDRETGSASGVMNALQQMAGATGVAVLGTVFFTVAAHGAFTAALRRTMWWELALLALCLLCTPLLPRHAPTEEEIAQKQIGGAGLVVMRAGARGSPPRAAALHFRPGAPPSRGRRCRSGGGRQRPAGVPRPRPLAPGRRSHRPWPRRPAGTAPRCPRWPSGRTPPELCHAPTSRGTPAGPIGAGSRGAASRCAPPGP